MGEEERRRDDKEVCKGNDGIRDARMKGENKRGDGRKSESRRKRG